METGRFFNGVMLILLMSLYGCNNLGEAGLSDIRFIAFSVLFLVIILSVAGNFKNGGKK